MLRANSLSALNVNKKAVAKRPPAVAKKPVKKEHTLKKALSAPLVPTRRAPPVPAVNFDLSKCSLPTPQEEEQASIAPEDCSYSQSLIDQQIENIDEEDGNNPNLVTEYVADIYAHLRNMERKLEVKPGYLDTPYWMNPRARRILVSWMIDLHHEYQLFQETLFMAVSLLDRTLQAVPTVLRENLQLMGATCMLIACKYEEVSCPSLGEFAAATGSTYNTKQFCRMEVHIQKKLNFELGKPLQIHFLRRFSKAGWATPIQHNVAKYLLELSLLDHNTSHFRPSMAAAAALLLSLGITSGEASSPDLEKLWTPTLTFYARFSFSDLMPAMKAILQPLFWAIGKTDAVRVKYSSSSLCGVANMKEFNTEWLKNMAAV